MSIKKAEAAVLTGDIVSSTDMPVFRQRQRVKQLQQLLATGINFDAQWAYELFQGDSFQGIMPDRPASGFRFALWLINACKAEGILLRVSVGLGNIDSMEKPLAMSNGTAFRNSGRLLEKLKQKKDNLIAIVSDSNHLNKEYEVWTVMMDFLLIRNTALQAQALALALLGNTQVQIAHQLQVSQPTIQQRLQAAGWPVFKAIVQRFESMH